MHLQLSSSGPVGSLMQCSGQESREQAAERGRQRVVVVRSSNTQAEAITDVRRPLMRRAESSIPTGDRKTHQPLSGNVHLRRSFCVQAF